MIFYVVQTDTVTRCFGDAGEALNYQRRLLQTWGVLATINVEVG